MFNSTAKRNSLSAIAPPFPGADVGPHPHQMLNLRVQLRELLLRTQPQTKRRRLLDTARAAVRADDDRARSRDRFFLARRPVQLHAGHGVRWTLAGGTDPRLLQWPARRHPSGARH